MINRPCHVDTSYTCAVHSVFSLCSAKKIVAAQKTLTDISFWSIVSNQVMVYGH